MDVSWLNIQAADLPDQVRNRVTHASEVCKMMIQTIQRLAFSISPLMLEDLGLNAAMEWLCAEFSVLHGIECSFEQSYSENLLTYEMKMDFFRICQETLADILDHASAGKIKVSIKDTGNGIELMIHDNGNGFATDISKQSNGLISIRERAKSINGIITLRNNHIQGTSVSLLIEKEYNPVATG
jgi:signal transduction histidine kinase